MVNFLDEGMIAREDEAGQVMLASLLKDPEFANVDSSENEYVPLKGTILRTKSGKFASSISDLVFLNQSVHESDFRTFWLATNERIVDWLLYESSSIICLKEFWVGNEELVQMYEQRLGDAGYNTFKLARTNNRGDVASDGEDDGDIF
ncbi:uncharacterized protein LOC120196546 [Hibiscus syriacus]|uniref:uncharacterized protein LOC120196546 n=1 Tax=Hibiscus syriacus TaxID=106335 RepID=UPI0019247A8B|nr:uncharacterized protein LOC120196546 [Hibiscus syriacus]